MSFAIWCRLKRLHFPLDQFKSTMRHPGVPTIDWPLLGALRHFPPSYSSRLKIHLQLPNYLAKVPGSQSWPLLKLQTRSVTWTKIQLTKATAALKETRMSWGKEIRPEAVPVTTIRCPVGTKNLWGPCITWNLSYLTCGSPKRLAL